MSGKLRETGRTHYSVLLFDENPFLPIFPERPALSTNATTEGKRDH
jgi:hypothetical protein